MYIYIKITYKYKYLIKLINDNIIEYFIIINLFVPIYKSISFRVVIKHILSLKFHII